MNNKVVNLSEYRDERIEKTPLKPKGKKKKRKFNLKQFLKFLFTIIAMIVSIYGITRLSIFNVTMISVVGHEVVDEEKIITLSEIYEGDNLFSISAKACAERVSLYPYVETAIIHKKLPNKVIIEIKERKAVGVVVTLDGYIQVSQDGIMLAFQPSLGDYNLPVISGIELGEIPSPGQMIINESFSSALKIISSCDPNLLANIAELNVSEKNYILAYTNQGVEIRLGDVSNVEMRMNDLNDILNDIVSQKIAEKDIQYIDMRYQGVPVIKMK